MKVEVEMEGGATVVRPQGKIDAVTSPAMQEAMDEVLESEPEQLVLDLSEAPFVSSAGLRVFAAAAKKIKSYGSMAVCGLNENVQEVFKLVGFDRLMELCPDVPSAIQKLTAED